MSIEPESTLKVLALKGKVDDIYHNGQFLTDLASSLSLDMMGKGVSVVTLSSSRNQGLFCSHVTAHLSGIAMFARYTSNAA